MDALLNRMHFKHEQHGNSVQRISASFASLIVMRLIKGRTAINKQTLRTAEAINKLRQTVDLYSHGIGQLKQ